MNPNPIDYLIFPNPLVLPGPFPVVQVLNLFQGQTLRLGLFARSGVQPSIDNAVANSRLVQLYQLCNAHTLATNGQGTTDADDLHPFNVHDQQFIQIWQELYNGGYFVGYMYFRVSDTLFAQDGTPTTVESPWRIVKSLNPLATVIGLTQSRAAEL